MAKKPIKNAAINIRLSTEDKKKFKEEARGCNMKLSEYVLNLLKNNYRKQGKIFPDSLKNILNVLYKLNIIEGYEQKDHKAKICKQVRVHNISEYFICFIWANVETTLNQVEYNRY